MRYHLLRERWKTYFDRKEVQFREKYNLYYEKQLAQFLERYVFVEVLFLFNFYYRERRKIMKDIIKSLAIGFGTVIGMLSGIMVFEKIVARIEKKTEKTDSNESTTIEL